jgi:hypothetical protein
MSRSLFAIALVALLGCSSSKEPVDSADHRVDATIADMTRRYDGYLKDCDHRGLFAIAYLRTTEQYRDATQDPAFFHDGHYVAEEDLLFAKYYFDHVDAWDKGDVANEPPAWTLSFQASRDHQVKTLGDALLGISAHINQDLPYVLATLGLVDAQGNSRKPDHERVNDFLAKVSFNGDVTAHWDATFDADYATGLPTIEAWREDAWANAQKLVDAKTPAERAAVDKAIADNALSVGQAMLSLTQYQAGESSAERDAFCAKQ